MTSVLSKYGGFQGLSAHCLARLAESLGQELRVDTGEDGVGQDGFSIDFRAGPTGHAPCQTALRGIVGAQMVGDALWVRAWIYPYFSGARVRPIDADVLVLRWHEEDDRWALLGWEREEPGESAAFETFGPAAQSDRDEV